MDWPHLVPSRWGAVFALGGGVVFAATLFALHRFRKPLSAIEQERRRRDHVDQVGRIGSAIILDVLPAIPEAVPAGLPAPEDLAPADFYPIVIYRYEVCGVEYEASQDISQLGASLDPVRCIPGMATSIKYDPADPGNSILASDRWNGVR